MPGLTPSAALVTRITRLLKLPGGQRLVSALISRAIPYTGTIKPRICAVDVGRAEVAMDDRRAVRNHLKSIHALALANLGEMAANLAVTSRQPEGTRWIVTNLAIEYTKKARGRVTAIAEAPEIDWTQPSFVSVKAVIRDAGGDVVATVSSTVKAGPR
jgi:acyl-coenzyme A thioesterase PaaI-like protein